MLLISWRQPSLCSHSTLDRDLMLTLTLYDALLPSPCVVVVVFYYSEVRAPIPQKQDILVEPEPLFGGTALALCVSETSDF